MPSRSGWSDACWRSSGATPDAYPLSLNALRLACNQATNRDPVVSYDEAAVVEALRRTALRGWTRLASGAGSRARKYRHLLDDALDRLVERGHVARLERRSGQKEERFEQLLGAGAPRSAEGGDQPPAKVADAATATPAPAQDDGTPAEARLERLERELAELREQVRELRDALGG